jgi:uncharacterized membrane protein
MQDAALAPANMTELRVFTPIIFGLLSALSWGTGDFCGGLATRRSNVYGVVITAEIVGAALLAALALLFGEAAPTSANLAWGVLAGLAGAVGLVMLYAGLASGRMGIVAPLSAVVAGMVPILVTTVVDGLPQTAQLLGFGLALAAVWLLSSRPGSRIALGDLWLPIAAGLGFGLYFVLIARVEGDAIYWPLVAARLSGALLLAVAGLVMHQSLRCTRGALPLASASGVFDAGGNLFFVLAAMSGRLDVAAVLSSLYCGATVLLAWIFLKERLTRPQWAGVAAALVAIALIAL